MITAVPAPVRMSGLTVKIAALVVLAAALMLPTALPRPFDGAVLEPVDRWALSALALALYVFGFSVGRGALPFGVLAFVFLTGGAAQLYNTEALWFTTLHLVPQNGREWFMAAFILLEAVVGIGALALLGLRGLVEEGGRRLGWGRIAAFVAFTFALSAPIHSYVWRDAAAAYLAHIAVGGALLVLHMAVLIAMSLVRSPISGVHRISPIVPAVFAVAASLLLAVFAFEGMPHSADEVAHLFQARTFAGGALTAPAPPEAAQTALGYYLLDIRDGRWFSVTAPGWSVALAAGMVVGLSWLINPLLAGLSVLMAYDIAHRKVGRDQADLVALMMASSPWLLAGAASMMPHTLTLALMLFAWWMILRAPSHGARGTRRLLLAGLAMGWLFATRPLDGLLIAVMTGLWVALGPGGTARRALPYTLGFVAVAALLLAYNAAITGSPLTLPLSQYLNTHWAPGANAYGFGHDIGPPEGLGALDLWFGHSPTEAAVNVLNMLASLQLELLGWSVGSLALIYAYFLWQRPMRRFDAAMMALIAAVILAYALYWYADSFYLGPRFWYVAAFPLLYLSARGYDALRTLFPGRNEEGPIRIDSILGLCCLFGLLVFTPWRGVVKYNGYNAFNSAVQQAAETGEFGNSVVLVDWDGDPGAVFYLNDPWLGGDGPVFLRDTGTVDAKALEAAFPGRTVLRFQPPPANPPAGQ